MIIIKKGFTLIELMIVIGIIGILAVIAIPEYGNQTAKAQVTEGVEILGGSKSQFIEYVGSKGILPSVAEFQELVPITANLSSQTKYIQSIERIDNIDYNGTTVTSYAITFATTSQKPINSQIAGKQLGFITPSNSANLRNFWTCSLAGLSNPVPQYLLPSACKSMSTATTSNSSNTNANNSNTQPNANIPQKCLTHGATQSAKLQAECAQYLN